jgi:hypothetical protein
MTRLLITSVAAAALVGILAAPATAVTNDKLAYLTFSGPVQIPGVTLNAGTYRFHLTNPEGSRNVVQVLSNDGAIVYAMFHTLPDVRWTVTADPTVTFMETPAGVPPAVRSLFYGGETRGYAFLYAKGEPNMTAEVWPQPEVRYTELPAVTPEVSIAAPALAAEAPVAVLAEAAPLAEPVQAPAELPRTAGPLPLMLTGGLTTLLVGLGVGLLRRRLG